MVLKSSVRAVIAITIIITTVFAVFYSYDAFLAILPIASLVIGFYFGKREQLFF